MILMTQNKIKSIIHSQIIRKLNPKNSPRMPPQSATRESRGKASISLLTRIFSTENIGHNLNPVVPSYGMYTLGFSLICKILTCLHVRNKIKIRNLILHKRARHQALCYFHEIVFSIVYCLPIKIIIFV